MVNKKRSHISLALLALCIAALTTTFVRGDGLTRKLATDFAAIDAYVLAQLKAGAVPGVALAIVKGDEVVYTRGYGVADSSGRPVTPQTPFIVGSVTKSFTALAVMQLVEQGQIDLDALAQRYLPWFTLADPQAATQITVRHLLNHTSGLAQTCCFAAMLDGDTAPDAIENHVRRLTTVAPNRPVGQSFEYSNANYVVLGALIQAVAGQSYEDYIKQHIFAPLAMRNSFLSQDEALQNGMALGHRRWFGIPLAVTLPYNGGDLPAGFLFSSAEDMAHFMIAQLNEGRYRDGSVLSPAGIALMRTPPGTGDYGMGMFEKQAYGLSLIGHEGGTFNFQSAWYIAPEEQVGVFVAANVINFIEPFSSPAGQVSARIAQSVLCLMTGRPLPDQGVPLTRLYLVFNGILLLLTTWLIWALTQIPGKYRRLRQREKLSKGRLVWRIARIVLLHGIWPVAVIGMAVAVPVWQVTMAMQPDLGYWLTAVAVLVLIKGAVEVILTLKASVR